VPIPDGMSIPSDTNNQLIIPNTPTHYHVSQDNFTDVEENDNADLPILTLAALEALRI